MGGRPSRQGHEGETGKLFLSSVDTMGEIRSRTAPRPFGHINENVVMRPSDAAKVSEKAGNRTGVRLCIGFRVDMVGFGELGGLHNRPRHRPRLETGEAGDDSAWMPRRWAMTLAPLGATEDPLLHNPRS